MEAEEARAFYLEEVWPRLDEGLRRRLRERWPRVRLAPAAGFEPLGRLPLRLVCGLTGSGKTTTLAALRRERRWRYREDLPARRDLAELVLIPAAQLHSGRAIETVRDRGERFQWTRYFAQEICRGGTAAALGWLQYAHDGRSALLGEGLRGAVEIGEALRSNPGWRIVELWLEPMLRLRRLSERGEDFDALARGAADVSFLPAGQRDCAREMLAEGRISARAVVIAGAEQRNYGAGPYSGAAAGYRCLRMEGLSPGAAAQAAGAFLFGADGR